MFTRLCILCNCDWAVRYKSRSSTAIFSRNTQFLTLSITLFEYSLLSSIMLFKSIAFIAIASTLVSGSAIDLEARQTGQLATCVITTTPSNTPRAGDIVEEFTTIFIREYVADIGPDAGILTGSTSVAPPVNGVYTVTRTTGSPSLTAEETRNILRGWVGETFDGGRQVNVVGWHIDSVTC
ncbi:hypothetical protein NMY22_g1082 [Coprinellus aureogranulatus]|nr:hypothetical protein NMY22_g1082 [Coprinellus aureogranulatus]